MKKRYAVMVCLACILIAASGCGPKKHPTVRWEGDVTLDGKPIPAEAKAEIHVQLSSAKERSVGASTKINNGHYALDVPQGQVNVKFSIYIEKPAARQSDRERGIMDVENLVPNWMQSGLKEAAGSENLAKNFDLTKKKPKD